MKRTFGIKVDQGWISLMQRRTELGLTPSTSNWLKAQGAQEGTKVIVSTKHMEGATMFVSTPTDSDRRYWFSAVAPIILCDKSVRKVFGRIPRTLWVKVV